RPERVAKALFRDRPDLIRTHPGPLRPKCTSENAPVAQLDRAPDYESGGQEFESLRARHFRFVCDAANQARRCGVSRGLRDPCHNVRPVFLEPGHGLGAVDDALEGFPGWVLQGFRLQSFRRILNEVMQAFVSWSVLEGICNRCAGPSSSGQIDNARSVSLAEPGCGIELDAADIIGGMASGVDHWIPPFTG